MHGDRVGMMSAVSRLGEIGLKLQRAVLAIDADPALRAAHEAQVGARFGKSLATMIRFAIEGEVGAAVKPLRRRIAALELEIERLKGGAGNLTPARE